MLHATIDNTKMIYSDGKKMHTVYTDKARTLLDLLSIAEVHGVDVLWITPASRYSIMAQAQAQADDLLSQYDVKFSTIPGIARNMPPRLKGVTARRLAGPWKERRLISVTWPEWSLYEWSVDAHPEAADSVTCLAAIHYLTRALGIDIHPNPGITGRNLMAITNSTHSRPSWIRTPNYDLGALPTSLGYDMAYQRGIDPTLLPRYKDFFVHAWDKNSAYLGACSSVYLGSGEPTYIKFDEDGEEGILRRWYDGKRPGYWHISYHPVDAASLTINPLYEGQEWVTTPLLKLLMASSMPLDVTEAYVWTEYHRPLDEFATRLWGARQSLKTDRLKYPHAQGAALAYHSTKRIATVSVGMLGNAEAAQYAPQWFRPDWLRTIVEEAKARIVYKVASVDRAINRLPVAIATDALYYLSPEADPYKAFPGIFDNEDSLGGWKLQASVKANYKVLSAFHPDNSAGFAARCIRIAAQDQAAAQAKGVRL
jgi:hypothetical protein